MNKWKYHYTFFFNLLQIQENYGFPNPMGGGYFFENIKEVDFPIKSILVLNVGHPDELRFYSKVNATKIRLLFKLHDQNSCRHKVISKLLNHAAGLALLQNTKNS